MYSPWQLCSKMISSPVRPRWCVLCGDCGTGWFALLWARMISSLWHPLDMMIHSPMHRMISSPIEASYPCSLGLMGSTSHLINEQGNEDRDHSGTDGRIAVSTVLLMLGWPSVIWDQWYWSGTSGRSCTHYDTNFGFVEYWFGTSGTYSEIDFESVEYWSGTSGRSCTHYDTDFGSVEDWSGTSGTYFETDFEPVEYWSGTSGRSCTYYHTDFGSVEDWSGTSGTHFETDFGSMENGMTHSRSILLLHGLGELSWAEQSQ